MEPKEQLDFIISLNSFQNTLLDSYKISLIRDLIKKGYCKILPNGALVKNIKLKNRRNNKPFTIKFSLLFSDPTCDTRLLSYIWIDLQEESCTHLESLIFSLPGRVSNHLVILGIDHLPNSCKHLIKEEIRYLISTGMFEHTPFFLGADFPFLS